MNRSSDRPTNYPERSVTTLRLFVLLSLLLFTPALSRAQDRLVLSSIDTTDWPDVRASIYLFSGEDATPRSIDRDRLRISENGTAATITSINCPGGRPNRKISSILTVDVSNSMSQPGPKGSMPNILLARAAAQAWIDGLPADGGEIAITSFDDQPLVMSDLTTDRERLARVIQTLQPVGGTEYQPAFLSTPAGALPVIETGKNNRIVVFLTDGLSNVNPAPVIERAKRNGITIYCVTLGMRAPDMLKQIAIETGGAWFENVTNIDQARDVYRAILYQARGGEPCVVTWKSEIGCTAERTITIGTVDNPTSVTDAYLAPFSSIPLLSVAPTVIHFDSVTGRGEVRITAPGAPVTIRGITATRGLSNFEADLPSLPRRLASGESITIPVRRRAAAANAGTPSVLQNELWRVEGGCSDLYFSGWSGSGNDVKIPIHLIVPNGGERFHAGEMTTIRWDGVPEGTHVRLDYSVDGGNQWKTIVADTSGGSYPWRVVGPPSDNCLARVTINGGESRAPHIARLPVKSHQWAATPQGDQIVGYLGDTTIRSAGNNTPGGMYGLWDTRTGALRRTWIVRGESTTSYKDPTPLLVETDPTGRYIFTGRYLMELSTGNVLWWKAGNRVSRQGYMRDDYFTSSFSPDGNYVLQAISKDGGSVLGIIESRTGRVITTVGDLHLGVTTGVFSPDGRTVLTSANDGVKLWDAKTGAELRRFDYRNAYSAVFSPDGQTVAAMFSRSDSVSWWRVSDGGNEQVINNGKGSSGYNAARFSQSHDGIIVWRDQLPGVADLNTGDLVIEYGDRDDRGKPVHFSHRFIESRDGRMVLSFESLNSKEKRAVLRDGLSGGVIAVGIDSGNTIGMSGDVSADGSRFFFSYGENVVIAAVGAEHGSDLSDNLWSIIGGTPPTISDVDFGRLRTGSTRDSLLRGYLSNRGSESLRVHSISIEGTDPGDFRLVSPLPPLQLAPGGIEHLELAFTPSTAGRRQATLVIGTEAGELRATLRGEGFGQEYRLAADGIDFGMVKVGEEKDTTISMLVATVGGGAPPEGSFNISGADSAAFTLPDAGERSARLVTVRFTPAEEGLVSSRMIFATLDGDPISVPVYGRGVTTGERFPDPTTFRSVAVPNGVIPPGGRIIVGTYDLLGILAGYSITDNIMILAGGLPLSPQDWGGTKGVAFAGISGGIKVGFGIGELWDVAAGFQYAESYYDREETRETESRITAPTPYAAISYGTDDRRISLTAGYAFKTHTTLVEPAIERIEVFDRRAPLVALGGDWRIGDRWKLAGEALYMKTVGTLPIVTTARYFGRTWALDFGAVWTFIDTGEDQGSSIPVLPMLSFIWTIDTR